MERGELVIAIEDVVQFLVQSLASTYHAVVLGYFGEIFRLAGGELRRVCQMARELAGGWQKVSSSLLPGRPRLAPTERSTGAEKGNDLATVQLIENERV